MQNPTLTQDAMLEIALDLSASLPSSTRYERLIQVIRRVMPCDALALFRYEDEVLIPVAVDGLSPETLGRRFDPDEHPRLQRILASRQYVRFADDEPSPDPFDGLVNFDASRKLPVHSCMGSSLYVGDTLVGALTLDALELGKFDHIEAKTFATLTALAAATMRTATLIEQLEQVAAHQREVSTELVSEAKQRGGELIGRSPVMRKLIDEVLTVARSDLSVLITGETGVGKEVVARTIHANSGRAHQPLVYVNCAALPESIAESELFGHVKGAFTGADRTRPGKFELADQGTIFLDEVGELPLSIQAKLLRVLQSGEVQRVGADHNSTVSVRVVAATNRDLKEEVKKGHFRADLYHRLSVFPLSVPPLRERQDDLALFAGHFLDQACSRLGGCQINLTQAALSALQRYHWPGNVRELEHVVMRAALRATQDSRDEVVVLDDYHLRLDDNQPAPGAVAAPGVPFQDSVEQYQRELISRTVDQMQGNWSRAAQQLQMDRSNLHRLAKRLGLK